jgi:hypothetical protein
MSIILHFLNDRLTHGDEVVSLPLAALYPKEDSWYSFLLDVGSTTVKLEQLGQLKNPLTSLGIEPATFRLVA